MVSKKTIDVLKTVALVTEVAAGVLTIAVGAVTLYKRYKDKKQNCCDGCELIGDCVCWGRYAHKCATSGCHACEWAEEEFREDDLAK